MTAAPRIGLTGGIGSGKSTVARLWVEAGAALIDFDAISRSLTAAGGAAIGPIAEQFGAHAVGADGAMNRDVMRQQAFSNPVVRQQLEAIIHPLISAEVARQSASLHEARCIVFDIPLLVESGRWRHPFDAVVVVDCSEATQISRVLARETGRAGWTAETVSRIIAGQASRSNRLAAADVVIFNDGLTLSALQQQVLQIAARFGL